MEITFEKVNEHRYEAYFEALGDFNLHVERVKNGTLEVYQRGIAEGEYDFAWSAGIGARKVIDYDFAAFVYPKWIKVVSSSEVVTASVNFNEGGGSGSGSGEISTVEYLDISNWGINNNKVNLVNKSNIIKVEKDGYMFCITPAMALGMMANSTEEVLDFFANATIAVCIDFNLVLKYPDGEFTNKELLLENGFSQEELDAIPRITKEEFYSFDNDNALE